MPYHESLANRVREMLATKVDHIDERIMFGGLTFMVNDKICVGVKSDRVLFRIDPALHEEELLQEGVVAMDHSGRSMKGFLFVDEDMLDTQSKLRRWVDLALEFNPRAKATPKKPS
jgi:TfoX/Sxy family transcriptional regulator of competence genes